MHVKTALESDKNMNFYTGRPLVPGYLMRSYGSYPELQTFPDLPELYQDTGRYLGVSPIKLQHFVRSVMGGVVDGTVKWTDAMRKDFNARTLVAESPVMSGILQWEPIGWRSKSVTRVSDIDRGLGAVNQRIKGLTEDARSRDLSKEERAEMRSELRQLHQRAATMKSGRTLMNTLKKMSKQVRLLKQRGETEKSEDIQRRMTEIARKYFKKHPEMIEVAKQARQGRSLDVESP